MCLGKKLQPHLPWQCLWWQLHSCTMTTWQPCLAATKRKHRLRYMHRTRLPFSREKKSLNCLDEIAGNMSNKCTYLLILILREHHVRKMNCSTDIVRVSYFVELPNWLLKIPWPFTWLFTDLSQIHWHFRVSRNSRKVVTRMRKHKKNGGCIKCLFNRMYRVAQKSKPLSRIIIKSY